MALGVGFGLILAFIFNFRTSYGIASIGQFVIAIVVHKFWTSTAALSYARLTSGLVAGFLAFQVSAIWPLERDYKGTNYANHPIWHPIVLGLGNPPSPLSDREGIRWSDDPGRIRPGVSTRTCDIFHRATTVRCDLTTFGFGKTILRRC